MARPRSFDSSETAQGLLDAFWRRGYAGTSIAHLTEATGLLPGSLYGAFGSKEGMFRVALGRYLMQLTAALATEKRGLEGIRHVLDAVVKLTVRDRERRGCLLINAVPEASALSAETLRELQGGLEAMRGLMRQRLAEAAEYAQPRGDLDELAALLLAASLSIRVLGRAGMPGRRLQEVAEGAVAAARRCFGSS